MQISPVHRTHTADIWLKKYTQLSKTLTNASSAEIAHVSVLTLSLRFKNTNKSALLRHKRMTYRWWWAVYALSPSE